MDTPSPFFRLFVGIDVAAISCAVSWLQGTQAPGRAITLEQTPSGWQTLQQRLLTLEPDPKAILVVLEATGTYWMQLALTLTGAHIAVAVVNPAQAHAFAKALLKRTKTDAIDAQTLTLLAARLQPKPWSPPPAVYTELQQRLVHRDGLIVLRTQLRNQLHALVQQPVVVASVQRRLETLITTLSTELEALDAEIAQALQQDEQWAATAKHLATIKGLGTLTIAWLLSATVNFTLTTSAEAACNYAGLAPKLRHSGTSVRGQIGVGHGGHARLRRVLYMATLSAIQHNPVIRQFYERLVAAGKARKVAVCAAARKLLCIAWAVATKLKPFDPHYRTKSQVVVAM
jgi:transposase